MGEAGQGVRCSLYRGPHRHTPSHLHTPSHTQSHPHSRTSRHALIHTCLPANQFLLLKWEQPPNHHHPCLPLPCAAPWGPHSWEKNHVGPSPVAPSNTRSPSMACVQASYYRSTLAPSCPSCQCPLLGACQSPSTPEGPTALLPQRSGDREGKDTQRRVTQGAIRCFVGDP